VQVVLQGSTSQQESVSTVQLSEALGNLTVFVFELVSFVNNDILPLEVKQLGHARSHSFKGSQYHVKLSRQQVMLEQLFTLVFGCDQI